MNEPTASASPTSFDFDSLRQAARSVRHPLTRALLVLTFSTGLIDAVSYLGLGRVFTANMTGNVVLLGFGIAGAGGLPVLAPIISLGAFLAGAVVGGALARGLAQRHARHMATALTIEAGLILLATILAVVLNVRPASASGDVLIALLALAMGVRAATVRRLAIPDLSTTVLTMTLTALAADSPLTGGTGRGMARRASAAFSMLIGAVAGALLLKTSLVLPLLASALLAVATWLVYVPAARRQVELDARAATRADDGRVSDPGGS